MKTFWRSEDRLLIQSTSTIFIISTRRARERKKKTVIFPSSPASTSSVCVYVSRCVCVNVCVCTYASVCVQACMRARMCAYAWPDPSVPLPYSASICSSCYCTLQNTQIWMRISLHIAENTASLRIACLGRLDTYTEIRTTQWYMFGYQNINTKNTPDTHWDTDLQILSPMKTGVLSNSNFDVVCRKLQRARRCGRQGVGRCMLLYFSKPILGNHYGPEKPLRASQEAER